MEVSRLLPEETQMRAPSQVWQVFCLLSYSPFLASFLELIFPLQCLPSASSLLILLLLSLSWACGPDLPPGSPGEWAIFPTRPQILFGPWSQLGFQKAIYWFCGQVDPICDLSTWRSGLIHFLIHCYLFTCSIIYWLAPSWFCLWVNLDSSPVFLGWHPYLVLWGLTSQVPTFTSEIYEH